MTATKNSTDKKTTDNKTTEKKTTEKKTSEKDAAETMQDIESLAKALQGDLTSIDPDAALKMIDDWHSILNQSKDSDLKEIGTGLKELQKLLISDKSGHDLGELLVHLGEQTSDAATDAGKELKTALQTLGKQLAKIGRSLTKESDRPNHEAINSLIEVLDCEVDKIDTKAAVGGIDQWYELLNKSEDKNLKAIATELKELKKLLTGSKSKSADLTKRLIKLGEQTIEAAADAGRGFKGVTRKLGKSLIDIAKSIDPKGE
jgi:hypothetical protein